MDQKYIYQKQGWKIIDTEMFLISAIIIYSARIYNYSYSLSHSETTEYHWAYYILGFFALLFLFNFIFYRFRVARYFITVCFSFIWGVSGFYLGRYFENDGFLLAIILAYIFYFFSFYKHIDQFDFEKDAEIIKYDTI